MTNTILITGANRGIGFELTEQYLKAGWHVIATCRKLSQAHELQKLGAEHKSLSIYELDVTDDLAVKKLASQLQTQSIDILLNNAGIFGKGSETLDDFDSQLWQTVLKTNTIAPFIIARAFLPHVARSQYKVIASISSGLGSIARSTLGGYYDYRSSKSGLNMIMHALSYDVADKGVTCVVLDPGWVQTDMGGPNADLTVTESVTGLQKVLSSLTLEKSGRFFKYDGTELPW